MEIPVPTSRLSEPVSPGGTANGTPLNGAPHHEPVAVFGNRSAFSLNAPAVPSPTPRPPGQADLTMKDLVDLVSQGLLIIRAKWYWGLLAAVILGGLAGFALLRRPVEYSAQTLLLAQNTLDKVISTQTDQGGGDTATHENGLRNHLSVMNSRKFRAKLIASFSPEEKAKIIQPYLRPGIPMEPDFIDGILEGSITIERERGREFYTIQVNHREPDVALMIADRFTAEYLDLVKNEFRDANKVGLDLLQKQSAAIRLEIAQTEDERLDFRKKNKIISRTDNQGILSERLHRLDSSLTDARVRRVQLETQTNQARDDRAKSKYPWDNPYLAAFANNEALRQELDRALAQRSVLSSRYGINHPKMRDVDASLQGIQDNIQRNFDVAVHDLESQLDSVSKTEKQLQTEFDEAFASSIEIEKLASRYEIIGTDVEGKRLILEQLQKKLGEASISNQLPENFMQIVDPAFLVKPRVPKQLIYLAIVALLSLGAFVTTPLAVNLLDERVKGTDDLETVLGKPLLGAVPNLKFREEDRAHVVRDRTDLGCSEAFIGISAQLDLTSREDYPKCALVTSTLPGEGKSMVVSNLAAAYTQLGKKVVILDLDLRRPTQQRLHGIESKAGFLSWARGGFPMENLLQPDGPLDLRVLPDGTHLIPAGGDDAQPSHHLVTKQLRTLIHELKSRYDFVIIDTPPAGVFQDAVVLSRQVQERVLVTREGKAPVNQVKKVISDFERSSTPFTGAVLNGFNPRVAHQNVAYGYHKDNYGYGKEISKPAAKAKLGNVKVA